MEYHQQGYFNEEQQTDVMKWGGETQHLRYKKLRSWTVVHVFRENHRERYCPRGDVLSVLKPDVAMKVYAFVLHLKGRKVYF